MANIDEDNNNVFKQNFIVPQQKPKGGLLRSGLLFVLIFWVTFAAAWIGMTSLGSPKDNSKKPATEVKLPFDLNKIGIVLGLQSSWDNEAAKEYLLKNKKTIIKNLNKSNLAGTYILTSASGGSQTSTISTEFSKSKEISYLSYNSLEGESFQVVTTKSRTLIRNEAESKWSNDKDLYQDGLTTQATSGGQIIDFIFSSEVLGENLIFKGVEEDNDKEILNYNISMDADTYREITDNEEYFSNLSIDFSVDPETNKLSTVEIRTKKLFIGEVQYDSNKTFEFSKLLTSADLENVVPSREDITNQKIYIKDTEVLLRFLNVF